MALNDCISEAVAIVQPQANAQRVIIRTCAQPGRAPGRCRSPLGQADRAQHPRQCHPLHALGRQVVVSTAYETNGSVVLRIRDTGIGMTRAELEEAMKPSARSPAIAAVVAKAPGSACRSPRRWWRPTGRISDFLRTQRGHAGRNHLPQPARACGLTPAGLRKPACPATAFAGLEA